MNVENQSNNMLDFLSAHASRERASFHMPGHKGAKFFERLGYGDVVRSLADFDITEIPGADDLREPNEAILGINKRYSSLYGSSRSFISVNGSSACIMAAIMTCVRPGHSLLTQSDSHLSVLNGAHLAGADLLSIEPETLSDNMDAENTRESSSGIGCLTASGEAQFIIPGALPVDEDISDGAKSVPTSHGPISPERIAEELDHNENIDAVIVTSPNYLGVLSDIKKIAEEVHKRGKILIVDQAHGAHLKFFDEYRSDPSALIAAENLGADIVIDSTHKTLCSFTQTAVANIMTHDIDADMYEKNLLTIESTSPSYILMASHAIDLGILEVHRGDLINDWNSNLDYFYDSMSSERGKFHIIGGCNGKDVKCGDDIISSPDSSFTTDFLFDRTKIVIDFSGSGITGEEAQDSLIAKGVYPEFASGSIVLCLSGIGNTRDDYELLMDTIRNI